jgi:hypothetical protein
MWSSIASATVGAAAAPVHTSQLVIDAEIVMCGSLPIEMSRLYANLQINSRSRSFGIGGG